MQFAERSADAQAMGLANVVGRATFQRGRPGPTSLVSRDQPIYFTGTRALEVRPGFVTLDIPLLERWAEPLGRLSREQRERFEEAAFYELLQREVATRLRLLPAAPG